MSSFTPPGFGGGQPKPPKGTDYDTMSSEALEAARLALQAEKDAILERMHAIVREQERRTKAGALRTMLAGMPADERNRFLDEAKKA